MGPDIVQLMKLLLREEQKHNSEAIAGRTDGGREKGNGLDNVPRKIPVPVATRVQIPQLLQYGIPFQYIKSFA